MSDKLIRYYDEKRHAIVYEYRNRRLEVSDAELMQLCKDSWDLTVSGRAAEMELQKRVEAWMADDER